MVKSPYFRFLTCACMCKCVCAHMHICVFHVCVFKLDVQLHSFLDEPTAYTPESRIATHQHIAKQRNEPGNAE